VRAGGSEDPSETFPLGGGRLLDDAPMTILSATMLSCSRHPALP